MQLLSQIIHIYDKFFVNNKFILGNPIIKYILLI